MAKLTLEMSDFLKPITDRIKKPKPYIQRFGKYYTDLLRRRTPKDSGLLAKSWSYSTKDETLTVSNSQPYALIQDVGGKITAGNGKHKSKYLAIPLNAEAKRIGKRVSSLRYYKGKDKLFVIEIKDGRLFLAQNRNKKTRFLFKLQKSVVIKAQHYIPKADDPLVVAAAYRYAQEYFIGGK